MKILKILLSIPCAALTGWLLYIFLAWICPIVMGISWLWFIVYLLLAGGFASVVLGMIATVLALPNSWLCFDNKIAKYIETLIFGYFGMRSVMLPWLTGVSAFSMLQWIIAISFTITVVITFVGLIGSLYKDSDD